MKGQRGIDDYLQKIHQNINSIVLEPTSQLEVRNTIEELLTKSSSRHDNVSNTLLKSLSVSLTYPLTLIFNQSFESGIFPDIMKLAEVIPLYKNKVIDRLVNYRPISLLMTMSKLLEKLMYKRVYAFINKYDILYKSQYGFCSHHLCEQAIQELLGKILQAREDGDQATSIFLDLSKALDTLDHKVLLAKLGRYGIHGLALSWFTSYLQDRSLVAKVPVSHSKIMYSKKFNIKYGTAQGSCLDPLLFIIFCNDIYLLDTYGSQMLFAYDTTLFNKHQSAKYLELFLTHDMEVLSEWFIANKLSLNMTKTVLMYFGKKDENLNISLDNTIIPRVKKTINSMEL